MTLEERKQRILDRIAEIQASGTDEEKADMQNALQLLGVTPVEQ